MALAGEVVKGPWTKEEDDRLRHLVETIGPQKWTEVAMKMGGRIGKQCRERSVITPLFGTGWRRMEDGGWRLEDRHCRRVVVEVRCCWWW